MRRANATLQALVREGWAEASERSTGARFFKNPRWSKVLLQVCHVARSQVQITSIGFIWLSARHEQKPNCTTSCGVAGRRSADHCGLSLSRSWG